MESLPGSALTSILILCLSSYRSLVALHSYNDVQETTTMVEAARNQNKSGVVPLLGNNTFQNSSIFLKPAWRKKKREGVGTH